MRELEELLEWQSNDFQKIHSSIEAKRTLEKLSKLTSLETWQLTQILQQS